MYYITLKKKYRVKNTYIFVVKEEGKRKILAKLGKIQYSNSVNKFVLRVNFLRFYRLVTEGVRVSPKIRKVFNKISNRVLLYY